MTSQARTLARDSRRRPRVARRLGSREYRRGHAERRHAAAGVVRGRRFPRHGAGLRSDPWSISFATCAKLFNHPDEEGASGTHIVPEVVRLAHGLSRRTHLRVRAEADVPFPHGRRGDGAELRSRLQPKRQPKARGGIRDKLHARDRRRPGGDRRHGGANLRCPRARPLPAADPAHEAARRLHGPADAAVLLPVPPTRRSILAGPTFPAPARTTSRSTS